MPVDVMIAFGHCIVAQRRGHILRVRHRLDARRVDRLQLVDQREDRVELDANFFRLRSIDLDARKTGDAMDVGGGKGHDGLALRRLDRQGGYREHALALAANARGARRKRTLALAAGDRQSYAKLLAPTVPLSRLIFRAPTQYYKTGVVFLAWLNGFQEHFVMAGGAQSMRPITYFAGILRLADQAGLISDPERAVRRMRQLLALNGI